MIEESTLVRSLWDAVEVPGLQPPYNTAHLRIYYAATNPHTLEVDMSGIMPAAASTPAPVVIFLGGVNIGQDSLRWLMVELVKAGYVAVTFDLVGEQMPGFYGTTPGLDLGALKAGVYGTRPPSIAIQPILDRLSELNREGTLAGTLDLDRIVLGGHSGGGTVALECARTSYFPSLRAVVTYAAHTVPAAVLGHPEGTVLEAASDVPALVMLGTEDGTMKRSISRYPGKDAGWNPVIQTFEEGIPAGRDDAWLVVWEGANHFGMGYPLDPTCARGFLDADPTMDAELTRTDMTRVIVDFLNCYVRDDSSAESSLQQLQSNPPLTVKEVRRR
ncbi:MAG TPA: alpha/beta hydrolase [Actinobacteria bacterium]|nr:alpha/beta hydrolase [Actinomycetota bacterium]